MPLESSLQGILWAALTELDCINHIEKRYPNGEPHHITLWYDVPFSKVEQYIGKRFWALAIAECYNDRAQALQMILPKDIPFRQSYPPHITVSYPEDSAPVQSAYMLIGEHCKNPLDIWIPVEIQFKPFE